MGLSKKGRYVFCADCGCRLEMNGVCKICGHADNPTLPGKVPNLVDMTLLAATTLLKNPEAQLVVGNVTEENHETVPVDQIISSDPAADTELAIGSAVNLVVSLGPAA